MPTFTVDTTSDVVDADDGVLSLREALTRVVRSEEADTILFSDAVQGGTIVLAGSELTVASDVTIDGILYHVYIFKDATGFVLSSFNGGWKFIVFEPDRPIPPGTLDLAKIVNYVTTRSDVFGNRWATGNEYLVSVELGDNLKRSSPGYAPGERRYCGEGELDIAGFVAAVRATGYAGPWAVEVFNHGQAGWTLERLDEVAHRTTAPYVGL